MILRVLRARVIEGEEARLARFVRDEAVPQALTIEGLQSLQPAIRETGAGSELIVVSTWTGFEDLSAAGRDFDTPLSMPGAATMLADGRAEHYELVIGEARSLPLREAKLRLTRITLEANGESAYFETIRRWADGLLDATGVVAFSLGRRVVGRQDEIVAVEVWEDEASLRDAAAADVAKTIGDADLARFWAADPAIEHFDALTAIDPRPDAPAIVVADNSRHYVHATPAAARLTGRPLARLLTMRVEDLSRQADRASVPGWWDRFILDGSSEGPYTLERGDGSEIEIRYASKANAPWPGSHASLLVPASEPEELDVDRALVEAGFVARYSPS